MYLRVFVTQKNTWIHYEWQETRGNSETLQVLYENPEMFFLEYA